MKRDSIGTPVAVVLAALLHLVIVGFLALAVIPCSFYESVFAALHVPESWNPITCSKPLELPGQIIEATLVGPTGAPPPKASKPAKTQPAPQPTPPPPSVTPPPIPQPQVKPSPLPPPPEHPDLKDQEKVVDQGIQKAEDAKKEQEEKQRQRQAQLDAQAAKQREEQKKIDDLFKQLDKASNQTKSATAHASQQSALAKQAAEQLKELQNAKDDGDPNLPPASQRQSGTNGPDTGLLGQYLAAIQNAVTQNWLRPDNMPSVPCVVHIVQLPGGQVMSAKVDSSCPYDEAGKRSVENAVLRAQPLPYQGFESVFRRNVDFTFRPQ